MKVTAEKYWEWATEPEKKVCDRNGWEYSVRVVRAPSWALPNINCPLYLKGDNKESEIEKKGQGRKLCVSKYRRHCRERA